MSGRDRVAWDFSTEPDFDERLAWMRSFVKEVAPFDLVAESTLRTALKQARARAAA